MADTVRRGGGLHAGFRHGSTRFDGTLTFARNTTVRAGVLDMNWNFGVGALGSTPGTRGTGQVRVRRR